MVSVNYLKLDATGICSLLDNLKMSQKTQPLQETWGQLWITLEPFFTCM